MCFIIYEDNAGGYLSAFSHPVFLADNFEMPKIKPLAQILFEKSCWQFEMPRFAKGHNSGNIWLNLFKSYSGNLLIIPNQLTKFEVPSSNGFQDILLISLNK